MPPEPLTWPLKPHTRGKHMVLKNHMEAWLPILTRQSRRVLFIDAFAGPGEYSGGEPGSPVIALGALIDHSHRKQIRSEVNYLFIDKDYDCCEYLKQVLSDLDNKLPSNCKYRIINATFDATLTHVLDTIDQQNQRLAPAFVMIDPFGVSDTPMNTIGRILKNPKSEVYISFMYRDMNRFLEHSNFEGHLDELFGCLEWRQGRELVDGTDRKNFLYDLYRRQLKKSGTHYVLSFELYEGEQLVYAIFFGTKNLTGCDKMKQAIWNAIPLGDFKFRGSQLGQLTLGSTVVDISPLEQVLQEQFQGKGWQRIENVQKFVMSDATGFHTGHLKRKTLRPMEADGKIEVKPGTRKRPGTYPKGSVLRFL